MQRCNPAQSAMICRQAGFMTAARTAASNFTSLSLISPVGKPHEVSQPAGATW